MGSSLTELQMGHVALLKMENGYFRGRSGYNAAIYRIHGVLTQSRPSAHCGFEQYIVPDSPSYNTKQRRQGQTLAPTTRNCIHGV